MERSLEKPVADPTYLKFFGLTQPPFGRLANSAHLFPTEQYSLLTEHLANATTHSDFLIAIRGADGSGKSTLIDRHVSSLGDHVYSVLIDETCSGEVQFYSEFLKQIGFEDITGTAYELKNITKEFLVCRGIAGDQVLVIIDNAHLTGPIILEQLRWLSGIKTKNRRLISAVLAGNADLIHVIEAPTIKKLNFGNHIVFSIRNYTREETASYVWHRLRLAGGSNGVKLSNEANALIHRYSGGIPRQINRLCDDVLGEAYRLETRVISEGVIRTIADRQGLLPHVAPLHGKGRRRGDPDFEHVKAAPETVDTTTLGVVQKSRSAEDSGLAPGSIGPGDLLKYVSQLSEQIENLRADKVRALQDIDARNHDIVELRKKLHAQVTEVERLRGCLTIADKEVARQDLPPDSGDMALPASEDRSRKFDTELEQEGRARAAAENELAIAAAAVKELSQVKQELQATVDDLKSDLEVSSSAAGERAEALEESTADLKDEIEKKTGELTSRDEVIASLEVQLRASQRECESAQLHMAALKSPKELEAIEKVSHDLAAELEQEGLARAAAESEQAIAAAAVEKLSQVKQELQASVDDLKSDLEVSSSAADERADAVEALEKSTADLKDEIEKKTGELTSRDEVVASLEVQLQASQRECESAQLHMAALKSPKELEAIEKVSHDLAAELEQEGLARASAENKLAIAAAAVEKLSQVKQELQASVDDLKSDLEVSTSAADERADAVEALEKNTADLKEEIEKKIGELTSRDEVVASLEVQLRASQRECESAQLHIAALKSPKELEAIEKVSHDLAAELEQEGLARASAENKLAIAAAAVEKLSQVKQELQASVDDLKSDLEVSTSAADERADEIEALMRNTADLKDEIADKIGELALRDEALASLEAQRQASQKECESAQLQIAALKSPQELEAVEKTSAKLAADLEQEGCARAAAENELAIAAAAVEELSQAKQELQASVDDLKSDLEVSTSAADERADAVEALEKNTADLKDEIADKIGELALRDEALASLEAQRQASQKECESAQLQIAALKSPQELEAVEKTSAKLAADLEQEGRARAAAENELAIAAAAVEELSQAKQELQASVDDLKVDLKVGVKVAAERADEIDALVNSTVDLKYQIEGKTRQLSSRDEAVAGLEAQLQASKKECEILRRNASALSVDENTAEEEEEKEDVPASALNAPVQSSHVVQKFEQSISNVRAYETLRRYDPTFYDNLVTTYKTLVGQDLTDKEISDGLRARQAKLIERLVPKASDEAIITYARLIVDELEEFHARRIEPCLTLLIPPSNPDDDTPPIYSENTKDRELETLDIALRTHDADIRLPTESEVWPDLEPIFGDLFDVFGVDNVAALQNAYDPSVDRALVCSVSKALYSGILKLPNHKAAKSLRWLFSD